MTDYTLYRLHLREVGSGPRGQGVPVATIESEVVRHRRLSELPAGERRAVLLRLSLRLAVVTAGMLGAYYLVPRGEPGDAAAVLRLVFGLAVFVALVAWQVRRILIADLPAVRTIDAIASVVVFFVVLFSGVYLTLSSVHPDGFSERLGHSDALYFTVTVLSTVGFGDIAPEQTTTRLVVSVQMLLDLVLIGIVARVLLHAAQRGLARDSSEHQP